MRLRTSGIRIVHVIGLFFLLHAVAGTMTGVAFAGDYGQRVYGSSAPADAASSSTGRTPAASRSSRTWRASDRSSPSTNDAGARRPSPGAAPPAGPAANVPHRGDTMKAVRAAMGAPQSTRGPVGQPPITRWDYNGSHVYFEHNRVLHTVKPGEPEALHHTSRLENPG